MISIAQRIRRWRRRRGVRIVTFFFLLPDPVPFADGSTFSFELGEQLEALEGSAFLPTAELPPVPWPDGHSFASLRFWRTGVGPLEFESAYGPVWETIRKGLPPQFHPVNSVSPPESRGDGVRRGWSLSGTEENDDLRLGRDSLASFRTVVEAVTPVDFGHGERALSDAFDVCFEKVSDLVRAYRRYSHAAIHNVTRERLSPFALFATRTLGERPRWSKGLSLMLLHMNVSGVSPDELGDDDVEGVMAHLSVALRGHPLAAFSERALDARVALEVDGDYGEALVQTQISCEILLDGVLTLLLWEEGASPTGAALMFEEGLAKRVRTHYASRLGGDWNPQTSAVLKAWSSDVSYVRGRVVHAGYQPTIEQARDASRAARELEDFVKERLAERRMRYPRTTLLTLGRPGLERLGVWSGQIQRFAETADQEPDWLRSYRDWSETFYRARST